MYPVIIEIYPTKLQIEVYPIEFNVYLSCDISYWFQHRYRRYISNSIRYIFPTGLDVSSTTYILEISLIDTIIVLGIHFNLQRVE